MSINVFEEMRKGAAYDIRQEDYVEQVHSEINRCAGLCQKINATDVNDKESILKQEKELLSNTEFTDSYFTPPFQIDCGSRVFVGKNVFANHNLTMMSLGSITIEDGVMLGPEVGLFTVNHEPKNRRVSKTSKSALKPA
jgi:acetyltransferase-like isoleucine patch superfamily enzyme